MLTWWLRLALAHPDVEGHLHGDVAPCDDAQRLRRAGALADDGRTDDALAELDAVCRVDELARLARARVLVLGGHPTQALEVLHALQTPDARVWRARALIALGRGPEAGAALRAALPLLADPSPQLALDAAAWSEPAEALAVLDEAVARHGPVAELQRAAARALASLGRIDDAVARLDPQRPADALLAGDLLSAAGRDDRAREAWTIGVQRLDAGRPSPAASQLRRELVRRIEATP